MDPALAVERSLPAFSATRPGEWSALEAAIVRAGVPRGLAAQVIAFAPIAFGRTLLDGMGIGFAPEYATPDSAARGETAGALLEHPMYAAALAMAAGMVARQDAGDRFVNTAVWSAEFSAINDALNAGSEPADLVAGPPLISGLSGEAFARPPSATRSEEPPPTPEKARPWWRFGR
jgi:hypothetical protein